MTLAITGGYVVPVDGEPIVDGTVLVDGAGIAAVGRIAEVAIPAGAERVDATGSWVLPGFIDAHTHVGVQEDGEGWSGNDISELTDPNGARFRAVDGLDPNDIGFDDALAGGVTSAHVLPGSSDPIGGATVAVKTWGRTALDQVISDRVGVKSALGENPKDVLGRQGKSPSTRLGIAAVLRAAFTDARSYQSRRDIAGSSVDADLTHQTLGRVLGGELTWHQHAHRADDIVTAIRIAEEFGYRLVLHHGTEAHLIADLLAERDVPVVVGPLLTGRTKPELRNKTLRAAGILARAGVRIALGTDHPLVANDLLAQQAAVAVKEGLGPEAALRALTLNPAGILRLDDRLGALRPGLDADVVVWSGDPLDVYSRALRVFVSGREVYRFDETSGRGVVADRRYREP